LTHLSSQLYTSHVLDELKELQAVNFDQALVSDYIEAVEGKLIDNLVPPEAIICFALKALEGKLDIKPGMIHTSQGLEIFKPIDIGATIYYNGQLLKKTKKLDVETSLFKVDAFNQDGELVLSAISTLVSPE